MMADESQGNARGAFPSAPASTASKRGMNMRNVYIITGICGHLGNTVATKLIAQGEVVCGLALPQENSAMLDDSIMLVRGNVCDAASMEPLFSGWKTDDEITVIHAAGIISISGKHDHRINGSKRRRDEKCHPDV